MKRVADVLARPGAKVLDLCCGTGDVLLSLAAAREGVTIFGSDFCHPMLMEAQRKMAAHRLRSPLFEADALALPLAVGFARSDHGRIRIPQSHQLSPGLDELARVLKPGGVLAILEFSQPTNRAFAGLYGFFRPAYCRGWAE